MVVYAALLVFVLVTSWAASAENDHRPPRLTWTVAAMVGLVLVPGLRYGTGTDTWTYAGWYSQVLPYQDFWTSKDVGFTALCLGISAAFGRDPTWMFLVASTLTVVPIVLVLRAYSRPFVLGMALHVMGGVYAYGFNGVRQALAGAMVFAGSKFLFDGRWKVFFLIVAAASLFHATAITFIPLYFIVNPRISGILRAVIAAVVLVALVNFESSTSLLTATFGSTRLDSYVETMAIQEAGANVLRVLVRLVIFGVVVRFRGEIERAAPGQGEVLVNMSLASLVLYGLSMTHLIYARVAYYPAMYEMLVLPALASVFGSSQRKTIALIIFACFLAYSTALLLGGESHLLPYRSVLE